MYQNGKNVLLQQKIHFYFCNMAKFRLHKIIKLGSKLNYVIGLRKYLQDNLTFNFYTSFRKGYICEI